MYREEDQGFDPAVGYWTALGLGASGLSLRKLAKGRAAGPPRPGAQSSASDAIGNGPPGERQLCGDLTPISGEHRMVHEVGRAVWSARTAERVTSFSGARATRGARSSRIFATSKVRMTFPP